MYETRGQDQQHTGGIAFSKNNIKIILGIVIVLGLLLLLIYKDDVKKLSEKFRTKQERSDSQHDTGFSVPRELEKLRKQQKINLSRMADF